MVSFVPVDHDPFAQTQPKLIPVEGDPFAPKKPGFFDRMNNRFSKRDQDLALASEQAGNGQFPGGNAGLMYNAIGQTLQKGLNDVPAEAISTVSNSIPQPVKQFGKDVYSNFKDTLPGRVIDPAVRGTGYVLGQASQGYNKFKQNHPTAGLYLDSTLGFGNALAATLPVKGQSIPSAAVEQTGKTLKAGSELVKAPVKNVAQKIAENRSLSREAQTAALRKKAQDNYALLKQEDIQLPEESVNKLANSLSSLTPKSDLEKRSWKSSGAAKHSEDILESISQETPSFNGLLSKRSEINSKIKVATRSGDDAEAYKLNRVKDALDEAMIGSDTGTWQLANHQWAQQAVLDDMDEIVNKALTKAQPANSLDTALNNYLNSYKSNSLSNEEWQALKDVTNNSSLDKLRKGAASGLVKYTAAAIGAKGGPVGAGAGYLMGHYGSEFLKDSAMASKVKRLDDFREMINARELPAAAEKAK
jgi:hypothetical protein